MATRRDLFDPAHRIDLSPEQRTREVAAILAAGVIRTNNAARAFQHPSCRISEQDRELRALRAPVPQLSDGAYRPFSEGLPARGFWH